MLYSFLKLWPKRGGASIYIGDLIGRCIWKAVSGVSPSRRSYEFNLRPNVAAVTRQTELALAWRTATGRHRSAAVKIKP